MNGRGFSGSYRFGYQGSEKDNEVSGDGNSYTTEFRQLDPRLGRWFSVDPVFQPWQSPYTSMDNDPINLNDVYGDKAGDKGPEIVNRKTNGPSKIKSLITRAGHYIERKWNSFTGQEYKNEANAFADKYGISRDDVSYGKNAKTGQKAAYVKLGGKHIVDGKLVPLDDQIDPVTGQKVIQISYQIFRDKNFNKKPKNNSGPDYAAMAIRLGVEENVIRAVAKVESGGKGFNKDGSIKIRFEGHHFRKQLIKQGLDADDLADDGYDDVIYTYDDRGGKKHGYSAYNRAKGLNSKAAKMATSYGAYQIMGFNYKAAGYGSVDDFVASQATTAGQVEAFINFVAANNQMLQALKDKDFTKFAKLYNGPSYSDNDYDTKMENEYEKLSE